MIATISLFCCEFLVNWICMCMMIIGELVSALKQRELLYDQRVVFESLTKITNQIRSISIHRICVSSIDVSHRVIDSNLFSCSRLPSPAKYRKVTKLSGRDEEEMKKKPTERQHFTSKKRKNNDWRKKRNRATKEMNLISSNSKNLGGFFLLFGWRSFFVLCFFFFFLLLYSHFSFYVARFIQKQKRCTSQIFNILLMLLLP